MNNKKKEISEILKEDRNWISINAEFPKINDHVVLRICHSTLTTKETEIIVYPLEDVKIGYYDGESWRICPPFPKYDYSPLTRKEIIIDDAIVTHWSVPVDKELEWWETRFGLKNSYKNISLTIDPEYEKDLYRALTWGSALINQYAPPDLKILSNYLYDLQHCIDFGNDINKKDGDNK